MSTTALEIDTPQLSATQLIARPGTLPTIAFPMTQGFLPDVEAIWHHLCGTAEFFGVPMPSVGALAAAISGAVAEDPSQPVMAVDVTIAEMDGAPQILLTRTDVAPARAEPVRIADGSALPPSPRATDPQWRRMAARTTSRGDADQLARWLTRSGFADAIAEGVPLLGALLYRVGGDVVGVENPEPTSLLEQLTRCGAISIAGRVDAPPVGAEHAWWISPRYQTHRVTEIVDVAFPVADPVRPPFARWS